MQRELPTPREDRDPSEPLEGVVVDPPAPARLPRHLIEALRANGYDIWRAGFLRQAASPRGSPTQALTGMRHGTPESLPVTGSPRTEKPQDTTA